MSEYPVYLVKSLDEFGEHPVTLGGFSERADADLFAWICQNTHTFYFNRYGHRIITALEEPCLPRNIDSFVVCAKSHPYLNGWYISGEVPTEAIVLPGRFIPKVVHHGHPISKRNG